MTSPRLEQLTGLRFCAASGVVLCHYAGVLGWPRALGFITDFFGSFVALFFVLSGFVLTHTYGDRLDGQSAPGTMGSYLVARVARVIPVYWLCLFGMLGLYMVGGFDLSQGGPQDYEGKTSSFLLNFLALQAWFPDFSIQQYWNAPGWSISAEIFFYLCFPLLLRWRWLDGSRRSFVILWAAMAVFLAGYFWGCFTHWADDPGRLRIWVAYAARCPLFGLYCFILGIHLARARQRLTAGARAQLSGRALAGWSTMVLVASLLVSIQKRIYAGAFYVEISVVYLVYTPYFYSLILFLLGSSGWMVRFLSRPGMVLLGDASYAFYLLHWLPLSLLLSGPAFLRGSQVAAQGVILGLIAISVVLFRGFEDPLRRRIRWYYQKRYLS